MAKFVLMKDEAAILAVFDPELFRSLADIHSRLDQAVEVSKADVVDARFSEILAMDTSGVPNRSIWTQPPRFTDGLLVLRPRQFRLGNAAPPVRLLATSHGLAVLDLLTDLVFAAHDAKDMFHGPEWTRSDDKSTSGHWLQIGSFVRHSMFGAGRVLDIGAYKGSRFLIIQFSDRGRMLNWEYGTPHLRPITPPRS